MESTSPDIRLFLTLKDISSAIANIKEWNAKIKSVEDYYLDSNGYQLLAASCMLLEAIGEGVNKCNKLRPNFLEENFPNIPWKVVVGLRNHIAHGYFNIDADVIFDVVKNDILTLEKAITSAIRLL